MHFTIGNADKRRDIAVQVQQACASLRLLCVCETSPTEIKIGTGRWSWSPTHISSGPDRRRSDRVHRAGERWRSTAARNRRRCASHAFRWHRPEWSGKPGPECPCGKACQAKTEDTSGIFPRRSVRITESDGACARQDCIESSGPDGRKHLNLHWETVQTRLSGFASTQIKRSARQKAA